MDEPVLPSSAEGLRARFVELREGRTKDHDTNRGKQRRKPMKAGERDKVLNKTGRRCHICGGVIEKQLEIDHVLAHSRGREGSLDLENLLPAHTLCNNYRWDYLAEEMQWVLKIGVWARTRMESSSRLGSEMLEAFFAYELRREGRKSKSRRPDRETRR